MRPSREDEQPVFEPDTFEWITWPTSRCENPDCYNWFDIDRKTCPLCSTVRGTRKRRNT